MENKKQRDEKQGPSPKLRDIPRDFEIRSTKVEFKKSVIPTGVNSRLNEAYQDHPFKGSEPNLTKTGGFYGLFRSPLLKDNLKLLLFKAYSTYACMANPRMANRGEE